MVVDLIAGRHDIELKERHLYMSGKGSVGDVDILLVEPLTFMNRSGLAVRDVVKRFNVGSKNLVIVHDDIDMETGKLKIRKKSSSGGHKGVESVIHEIGTKEFIRVKMGVGREEGMPVEEYVLRKFRRDEAAVIKDTTGRAADAIEAIITDGVDKAMSKFN